jgi:predicted GNAT family acetyltransferase
MDDLEIAYTHEGKEGAWFISLDGRRVGEMVYVDSGADTITIVHTQVGDELRGKGAGLKLVEAGVAWAREHGKKVVPQCPFARATIQKHKALQDVLAAPMT